MFYYFKRRNAPTQQNLADQFEDLGIFSASRLEEADLTDAILDESVHLEHLEEKAKLSRLLKSSSYHPISLPFGEKLSLHKNLIQCYPYWILKPNKKNNGQGIKVVSKASLLNKHSKLSQMLVQQYIETPWLIEGKKFSIRLLVILSNRGRAYLYREGYLNVSQRPYALNDLNNLVSHLTNEHLSSHYQADQRLLSSWNESNMIISKSRDILADCLNLFQKRVGYFDEKAPIPRYSFWGIDFMMDEKQKIWLLEANHGPCFPVSSLHPLFKTLYAPFWKQAAHLLLHDSLERENQFVIIENSTGVNACF